MKSANVDLAPGTILAGRYRVERLLGEGGMGVVWAATHIVTRRMVALKFLKPAHAASPSVRQRFLREARAATAVRHPNVVDVTDVLELADGSPLMVMDYLEGESLKEKLERERTLALAELARLLLPVLSAVGTAHAVGIVHRDLKPDNIFLARASEGVVVKVLDFGIAKLTATEGEAAQTAALTGTGAMLGTPYYMSPEQIFGEKDIDHRSDIWALGVILYECLCGSRPTEGDNIGRILKIITTESIEPIERRVPGLPDDVVALIGRMLTRDRDKRPQSLAEVKQVLQSCTDLAVPAFGPPVPARGTHAPALRSTPSGRPQIAGADTNVNALAATSELELGADKTSLASSVGAASMATTNPGERRTRWLTVGAVALLGAVGIGALAIRAGQSRGAPARASLSHAAETTTSPRPPAETTATLLPAAAESIKLPTPEKQKEPPPSMASAAVLPPPAKPAIATKTIASNAPTTPSPPAPTVTAKKEEPSGGGILIEKPPF